VDELFTGGSLTPSSAYGPVPDPGGFPRLPNHEAQKVVDRRFGLFFEAMEKKSA
jgi:hypothetical protein